MDTQLQSFNHAWVQSFESEKAFLEEMQGEGYAHLFKGKGRTEKLKEVYRAIKKDEPKK